MNQCGVLLPQFNSYTLPPGRSLAGDNLIRQAYQAAIDESYRFYSYGDAILIE